MSPSIQFRPRHRQGLTLVEMLVVFAVIGIVGTMVLLGVRRATGLAKSVQSSENLRNLAIANANYLVDNGVYCPAADRTNNRRWHGARTSGTGTFDPKKGFLSPYLGQSEQVTACPLFKPTSESSFEEGTGGYGYNAAYIGGLPGGQFDKRTGIALSQRPANITNPARTVMFTTTAYARSEGLQEAAFCEPPFWDYGDGPGTDRPSPTVHFRANGKALVAWCDGRVTAEVKNDSSPGANPHGGDAGKWDLGWFGPDDNNGWWNPRN